MTERVALVTGVSRGIGIGAAVARALAGAGHRLLLTGLPRYDDAQPYGGDPQGVPNLLAELGGAAHHVTADLLDPAAPADLVAEAVRRYGRLDTVVAVHAYSTRTSLGTLEAGEIDRHLLVNVRATLLLAEAFAAAFTGGAGGRLVLFSSGQRLGPMPDELAYAVSKAAVENLTTQLAPLLTPRGITVNCLNPGPTDTGYAPPEVHAAVARHFPGGQWGTPEDAARLVAFLCSPEARWVTGQVIDSEGGFQRYA
ncbi:SDR family oxidoreductase [Micromonospora sagamiensis]|uniref:3-oxoacyl-[acyl-carrier protein] reductase n=1 Tax=Micromonospora sagamiensis TaxID=47875 RepID=A0A562WDG7_9ACTN|nr:SDR family oxidoreductase [Micromonospora sagamiensis]TWJ28256.1 3-oxoacyl-[acyl-carrier protein] reductase [Micromonospora sagamiensis]BCL12852.1 3-ketoacyl-ACP reductase [Micromonospora sagamiensis]